MEPLNKNLTDLDNTDCDLIIPNVTLQLPTVTLRDISTMDTSDLDVTSAGTDTAVTASTSSQDTTTTVTVPEKPPRQTTTASATAISTLSENDARRQINKKRKANSLCYATGHLPGETQQEFFQRRVKEGIIISRIENGLPTCKKKKTKSLSQRASPELPPSSDSEALESDLDQPVPSTSRVTRAQASKPAPAKNPVQTELAALRRRVATLEKALKEEKQRRIAAEKAAAASAKNPPAKTSAKTSAKPKTANASVPAPVVNSSTTMPSASTSATVTRPATSAPKPPKKQPTPTLSPEILEAIELSVFAAFCQLFPQQQKQQPQTSGTTAAASTATQRKESRVSPPQPAATTSTLPQKQSQQLNPPNQRGKKTGNTVPSAPPRASTSYAAAASSAPKPKPAKTNPAQSRPATSKTMTATTAKKTATPARHRQPAQPTQPRPAPTAPPTKSKKRKNRRKEDERSVLLIPATPKDQPVLDQLKTLVNPRGVNVTRTVQFPSGAALIHCGTAGEAALLRAAACAKGTIAEKPQRTFLPEFRIHGIDNTTTIDELQEDLERQLGKRASQITFVPYKDTSRSKTKLAICHVDTALHAAAAKKNTIRVGWVRCHVDTSTHLPRCRNCQLLGHVEKHCKNSKRAPPLTQEKCVDCVAHNQRARDARLPKSMRKNDNHPTNHASCPVKLALIAKYQRNRNRGSPAGTTPSREVVSISPTQMEITIPNSPEIITISDGEHEGSPD